MEEKFIINKEELKAMPIEELVDLKMQIGEMIDEIDEVLSLNNGD